MDILNILLPTLVQNSKLLCFLYNSVNIFINKIHNNIFDDLYIRTYTHVYVVKQYGYVKHYTMLHTRSVQHQVT